MSQTFTTRLSEAYGSYADKYVSVLEPFLAPMAEQIASFARFSSEQLGLDLATGTGLVARALALTSGSVIGADISIGILRLARSQAEDMVAFVSADAHKLPFKKQCFDLVTCGLSLSHFSDIRVALGEIRRLLRPGGRFIASAWGTKIESSTKAAAVEVRNKYLAEIDVTFGDELNEELWADVERGRAALRGAGFEDIQVITSSLSGQYNNHSEAKEAATAWPITRYRISQLSLEEQKKLQEETVFTIRQAPDLNWWSEIHYYVATRAVE
jgi:SAM-dependent methyltransferase